MVNERWREVEELFSALNALMDALDGERKALLAFDIDSLERWTQTRAQCLVEVQKCARPWDAYGCPWPLAAGAKSVAEALLLMHEQGDSLSSTWRIELKQRCERIAALQRELAELSCRALHWINQCLGEEESVTYDGYGARVVPLHGSMVRRIARRV